MTVSTTARRVTYTGTGVETALAISFPFIDDDELVVTKTVTATGIETVLVKNTHYTVSGGDYSTGTVTPIDGATDFPASVTWTIERVTARTQTTDYVENDSFSAVSHERALDKATLLIQEFADDYDRTLRQPAADTSAIAELPTATERASKYLAFDADGDPVATDSTTPSDVTVTAFAETLLDDTTAAAARATLDAQQDVFTTRGDMVRAGASGVAERFAIGTSGYVLQAGASDPGWVAPQSVAVRYPDGYFKGGQITRASATTITFGTAKCRDNTDAVNMSLGSAYTKSSAGTWVAGTGQNGMGHGLTIANSTWYHLFYIAKADGTTDCGFDTSTTCANLLNAAGDAYAAGFLYYCYAGVSVKTDGAAQFVDFIHYHETVMWPTPVLDSNAAGSATAAAITLASVPTGYRVFAHINVAIDNGSGNVGTYIAPTDADTLTNPSLTVAPLATAWTSANDIGVPVTVLTDTSAQVTIDSSAALTAVGVAVLGWTFPRGKVRAV